MLGLFLKEKSEAQFAWTLVRAGFGAFMHTEDEGYRRRAIECLAFAAKTRDDEERAQLLIMAHNLKRLALSHEQKAARARKAESCVLRQRHL